MSMIHKVYHHPICPFSRKLRFILQEKGLLFQLEVEEYWKRRPQFLAMNPFGVTPVISYKKGVVIGNFAISAFLEEVYPEPNFIGKTQEARNLVRAIEEWCDYKMFNEVTKYLINEKAIKVLTDSGAPNSEAIRAAKYNLNYHLEYFSYLLKNNRYLVEDRITLADIAACAQISVLDFLGDISWERYPKIKDWYCLLKSRPSFRIILRDSISAITPPPYYENPDF